MKENIIFGLNSAEVFLIVTMIIIGFFIGFGFYLLINH